MADFIIPKGQQYKFTIKVIEKDSFIAQDLLNMDTVNSSFKLIVSSTATAVPAVGGSPITMVRVPDSPGGSTYLNGIILVTMPAAYTATLNYARGDAVDDYYLKPLYQGIVTVKFTDGVTGDMTAIIDKVYVVPTGA